jgi:hypothetical protein
MKNRCWVFGLGINFGRVTSDPTPNPQRLRHKCSTNLSLSLDVEIKTNLANGKREFVELRRTANDQCDRD